MNRDITTCILNLACPRCHSPLRKESDTLHCTNPQCSTSYTIEGEIPFFVPDIDIGKYDEKYANKYAGVWAYGYKTLHFGEDESLYRTVNELVLSSAFRDCEYTIVDAGCGVGRVSGDCGKNFERSTVFGVDASKHMLEWAYKINVTDAPVEISLSHMGFGKKTVQGMGLKNVWLVQADVHALPFPENTVDIGLNINVIDRAKDPHKVISEVYRILKKGGFFVFTNPLDWEEPHLWDEYPDAQSVLSLFTEVGFTIEEWFDGLYYREILDARGSYEDWRTLVIRARK
jgi:ubiquinone/menaquinone biosynthesis C-methylase UbiE